MLRNSCHDIRDDFLLFSSSFYIFHDIGYLRVSFLTIAIANDFSTGAFFTYDKKTHAT